MKTKKIAILSVFFLTLFSFVSCNRQQKITKIEILNNISYLELPQSISINYIDNFISEFQPLPPEKFNNLSSIVKDEKDFLWLKIDFTVPEKLKKQDLGFFISFLRSANKLWLNGNYCGGYGQLPPEEFGAGLQAHYYPFSEKNLNQDGKNTIYIQLWCGATGSISKHMFISNQKTAHYEAEVHTFFSSRIFILFTGFILVIAFIFAFTYFALKKESKVYTYLVFSLLCLYTVHFLIPFFAAQTPWVIKHASYLTFIKILFAISALTTVYFASSFISCYLGYDKPNRNTLIRLIVLVVFMIISMCIPDYSTFNIYLYFVPAYIVFQLSFAIVDIVRTLLNPQKKKIAYKLLIGFSPVLILLPGDLIIRFGFHYYTLPYLTAYGWQITIYIYLSYLIGDLVKAFLNNIYLNHKLTDFNEKLENEVEQRTLELTKTNSMLADQITRTNADLMTATLVQQGFMPPKTKTFNGWEIAICYTPLSNVSGDLYDYYSTNNTLDGVCLFDVSGHGTSAGLVTMLSKNIINQNFKVGRELNESVSEILVNVNENIISAKSYADRYLTGVLFNFEAPDENDLVHGTLANAGHPYPLIYSKEQDTVSELKCSDSKKQYGIIGLADFGVSFPNIDVDMAPGDVMVCFTDGITESTNEFNKQFGTDLLKQTIKKFSFHSANRLLEIIIDTLNEFIGKSEVKDDITVIVLKRLPKDK